MASWIHVLTLAHGSEAVREAGSPRLQHTLKDLAHDLPRQLVSLQSMQSGRIKPHAVILCLLKITSAQLSDAL